MCCAGTKGTRRWTAIYRYTDNLRHVGLYSREVVVKWSMYEAADVGFHFPVPPMTDFRLLSSGLKSPVHVLSSHPSFDCMFGQVEHRGIGWTFKRHHYENTCTSTNTGRGTDLQRTRVLTFSKKNPQVVILKEKKKYMVREHYT